MEITLNTLADIEKFISWTIQRIEMIAGTEPQFVLIMTHPAAACPVKLRLIAEVQLGRCGNLLAINPMLGLRTEDVKQEE